MFFTGKNLMKTGLMLVLPTKLVKACDYDLQFKEQVLKELAERDFNVKLFFFSTIFLILANVVLFFVRSKKDYWLLITIVATVFISAPITFFATLIDMCGNSIVTGLQANFFIFLCFFTYQILLWANRTSLQFKKRKITTLNLR